MMNWRALMASRRPRRTTNLQSCLLIGMAIFIIIFTLKVSIYCHDVRHSNPQDVFFFCCLDCVHLNIYHQEDLVCFIGRFDRFRLKLFFWCSQISISTSFDIVYIQHPSNTNQRAYS